jgi:manganese oxidase
MREIAVLMILSVCVAFAGGCTAQISPWTPASPEDQVRSGGPEEIVLIKATSFDPYYMYIRTGTTITWVNEDRMSRHVVHLPTEATGRELFNSGSLAPGESFSYTFDKPGRYVYADPQYGGGRSPFVNVTD